MADCFHAVTFMLSVAKYTFMLSVIMLNAVMLCVLASFQWCNLQENKIDKCSIFRKIKSLQDRALIYSDPYFKFSSLFLPH